jgi:outer membrane immunogenic protein
MKKLLLVSAVSFPMLAGLAQAADVSVASADWSGFYLGVAGGLSQSTTVTELVDGAGSRLDGIGDSLTASSYAGIIGGTIGANFQADQFVFGVEADYSWTGNDGSESVEGDGGALFEASLNSLATIRGRIGMAFDSTLIYATAGAAYGSVEQSFFDESDVYENETTGHWGWTAGAGMEYAMTEAVSVKLEGLYYDLGSDENTYDWDDSDPEATFEDTTKGVIVRAGVNYRFGL